MQDCGPLRLLTRAFKCKGGLWVSDDLVSDSARLVRLGP